MPNIACRIFKEQIDLINQLPEEERPKVLYASVMQAFNQIENQNENQNDNQIANQFHLYLLSVSVSELGIIIYNILTKNLQCREFSTNYGGARAGAGRKKQDPENHEKIQKILKEEK